MDVIVYISKYMYINRVVRTHTLCLHGKQQLQHNHHHQNHIHIDHYEFGNHRYPRHARYGQTGFKPRFRFRFQSLPFRLPFSLVFYLYIFLSLFLFLHLKVNWHLWCTQTI